MSDGEADPHVELRAAYVELLAAERRLRGRDARRSTAGDEHLSMAHYRLLVHLIDVDERTAGNLAEVCDLRPATVTGLLDALEREGLAERGRAEGDRRVVTVRLTPAGRERVVAKRAHVLGHWREALADLDDDELAAGSRTMRRIAGLLDGLKRED